MNDTSYGFKYFFFFPPMLFLNLLSELLFRLFSSQDALASSANVFDPGCNRPIILRTVKDKFQDMGYRNARVSAS